MKKASKRPRLQCLGEALEMLEIEISVRQRAGIPPGRGVNAYRAHECAQVQLTRGAHSCPNLVERSGKSTDHLVRAGSITQETRVQCSFLRWCTLDRRRATALPSSQILMAILTMSLSTSGSATALFITFRA